MSDSLIYVIFFIISSFFIIDFLTNAKDRILVQFYGVLIILVIVAAGRSVGFGSDDLAYIEIYKTIAGEDFFQSLVGYEYSKYNIEFGFFLLLSLLSLFGGAQFILFGGVSLLSVYFNLRAIRGFTPYFVASVLIYFSHFYLAKELNAIRVGFSSALLFFAALAIFREQWVKSLFFWLVAVFIHISAVFFVLPVILYSVKLSRAQLIALAVLVALCSFSFSAKELAIYFTGYGFVGEKLSLYLGSDEFSYGIPLLDVVNIKNISILILAFLLWNKLVSLYSGFYISFVFFYSATLFRVAFGDFAVLAGRGYSVISMFEFVLIPMVLSALLGRGLGLASAAIYALVMLWMNLNFNTAWSGGVEYFHDWQFLL